MHRYYSYSKILVDNTVLYKWDHLYSIANCNEQALRRRTGDLSHQADTAMYYTVRYTYSS